MSAAAIAEAMKNAGCTIDQIVQALKAYEESRKAKGRAANARRQAEFRARRNENNAVISVTESNENNAVTPVTGVTENTCPSRARSLCVEDSNNIPPVILTDDIPQGGKREKRARRIPDDWNPSQRDIEFAIGLGFSPDELATARDEFREYWQSEGSAKARKLDWDLTFRGRLRFLASRRRATPAARAGPRQREPDPYSQFFLETHGLAHEQHRETFDFRADPGPAGVVVENGT